ncbi:MAG TPA: hypothetical protein VN281_04355 [Verrucomicrobiae bacterium]|jgi:hypothetical protein|nr:hypothetical protein [Verrucomicrobiae bacterium]
MVDLVNGSVLFAHRADWQTPPTWQRTWSTGITESILGNEARAATRQNARISLTWTVAPRTLQEQSELDDRIRAALKSGNACTPYHGRGSPISADVTNVTVNLADATWPWAIGDYIFLQDDAMNWDVRQLTNVTGGGATLTLGAAVSRTYPVANGLYVFPLLFGKLSVKDVSLITNWHGEVSLTLQELTSRDAAQLGGNVNHSGAGIGWMTVGTTNIVG